MKPGTEDWWNSLPDSIEKVRERNRLRDLEEEAEVLAFDELEKRGRDPRIQKRFRGRISLQLRCRKGHSLADVYPTGEGLVFVPWAELNRRPDQMPTSMERRARREDLEKRLRSGADTTGAELEREIIEVAPVFEALWRMPRDRQPFSREFLDEDGNPVRKLNEADVTMVRGIHLLTKENLRLWASSEMYESSGWDLACRCGPRPLFASELARLIDRGVSRHYI